jgi:hypothetical protein
LINSTLITTVFALALLTASPSFAQDSTAPTSQKSYHSGGPSVAKPSSGATKQGTSGRSKLIGGPSSDATKQKTGGRSELIAGPYKQKASGGNLPEGSQSGAGKSN